MMAEDLLDFEQVDAARYTHLTSHTNDQAKARIDALMARFTIDWGAVK